MFKKLAIGAGVVALSAGVLVAPANAAPANEGAACVQAGLATLKKLDLLQAAAQKKLDYAPLGSQQGGAGLINIPFSPQQVEDGVYFSLGYVVKLHTTNPEYFDWCAAS